MNKRTDYEAVQIIAKCEARGLEKAMQNNKNLPRPAYRASVCRLLETQKRLVIEGCDANTRAEVLAHQYQEDTKSARVWARLLADADEMVAKEKFTCCI